MSPQLLPNLDELIALLDGDGLAKALAVSAKSATSTSELEMALQELVEQRIQETREGRSDA